MNTITRHRLTVATLSAALALTLVAGCSCADDSGDDATTTPTALAPAQQWDPDDAPTTTEPTAPTPATALDKALQVDRSDPEQLAQAAVKIWFSWDTSADDGPNDAAARTAPLLTTSFADSLFSTGSNSPGGQWLTWAADDAVITPTWRLLPDQGAPQTADRKYFVYEIQQTARTPEGNQIGKPATASAWVICVRTGDDFWEVSQLAQR
ncbi:MAG: hypothetical protein C0482_22030 [Gordonia sp.]|nr:hypothetical protein [Gordonia sp. (in: high G+C Gram-positive bacteria)]